MTVSPQAENGHTDVSNELLDFMCSFRIPGECRQVFDAIMRKTWGWHKKEDYLAGTQIVELTKMKKANVSRSLSKLIKHGLVIKSDNKLRINKDYSMWTPFGVIKSDNTKKVIKSDNKVIKKETKVIKSDNKKLSKVMDTKEKKETNTKESRFMSADSFFDSLKVETSEQAVAKAKEFDLRPKDIAFSAKMANSWCNGKEIENQTKNYWENFLDQWITRGIRRHELKTLSEKEEEEQEKSKPKLSSEDKWILENVKII